MTYTREQAQKALDWKVPHYEKDRFRILAAMVRDLQKTMDRVIDGADLREAIDCLHRTGWGGDDE